jgi:hypothetical protein
MDMQNMAQLMQMLMAGTASGSDEKDEEDEDVEEDNSEYEAESDTEAETDDDDFFSNINIDFDMLNKMGEVFSHMNKPDMNAELLLALKPHLRDENQHKVDNAVKMSKMMAMIPFLKESGILNDLF